MIVIYDKPEWNRSERNCIANRPLAWKQELAKTVKKNWKEFLTFTLECRASPLRFHPFWRIQHFGPKNFSNFWDQELISADLFCFNYFLSFCLFEHNGQICLWCCYPVMWQEMGVYIFQVALDICKDFSYLHSSCKFCSSWGSTNSSGDNEDVSFQSMF